MTESDTSRPAAGAPVHLWIVGVLALAWNALGAFDYLATQLEYEPYMSQFTEEQLAYFYGFPSWLVGAWAFAVWGGVAGAIGLLLRRRWAVWAFGISVAGMLVSTIHNFGLSEGAEIMGQTAVVFNVVIWVVALLLLFYSWKQTRTGVLR